MDKKDTKILSELMKNSRISLTQLSKKVKLSREVINYRLKKLEKDIIKQYSSQINIKAFNFQRTGCYIILQNSSSTFETQFINFLQKHEFIAAISTNIGKYDIIFDIFFKNNKQLQETVLEIEEFLKEKLKEFFLLSFPIEQEIFYEKILGLKSKEIIPSKKTITKIDNKDIQILKILNKNSRESLVNLVKVVGLKANAIGYRIKELQRKNIITNSTIFVDFEELGFDIYNIQLKINSFSTHKKIKSFLRSQPSVFYYYQYFGNKEWDIDIGIAIKEKKELKKIISELKENFGEIINFKEIYLIEKIFKEELPEGIFKNS